MNVLFLILAMFFGGVSVVISGLIINIVFGVDDDLVVAKVGAFLMALAILGIAVGISIACLVSIKG